MDTLKVSIFDLIRIPGIFCTLRIPTVFFNVVRYKSASYIIKIRLLIQEYVFNKNVSIV